MAALIEHLTKGEKVFTNEDRNCDVVVLLQAGKAEWKQIKKYGNNLEAQRIFVLEVGTKKFKMGINGINREWISQHLTIRDGPV